MFPEGHRLHDPELPPATLTPTDLDHMKQAVLLGDDDDALLLLRLDPRDPASSASFVVDSACAVCLAPPS